MQNKNVAVIIVNWNSGGFLQRTVESLYEETKGINNSEFEVIILDNLSNQEDSSYIYLKQIEDKYPNLKVVFNEENLGFAKANNIGMDMAKARNILLLNPDVLVLSDILTNLSNYLDENDSAGMIGPKVLNPDKSFQQPCLRGEPYPIDVLYHLSGISKLFKNNPIFNKYSLFHLDTNEIHNVAILSGCCMMVKKELIDEIGKMDEQFFLYQEEPDWCWRAVKAGWKVVYYPLNSQIIHEQGVSTSQKLMKTSYIFTESMIKFFKKHHWPQYNILQKGFFIVLIWCNFLIRYTRLLILSLFTSKRQKTNGKQD